MMNCIKKYIPGQVWNVKNTDNTEKTFIIITEGESMMVLKVANRSRVNSAWHYDYDVDNESMAVVIDQPSFINSRGLGGSYGKYLYTMPKDMLAEIVSHYAAYIFYNSTGVAPDEGVIKNIMASHTDTVVESPKEPVIKRSTPTPKEPEAPAEEGPVLESVPVTDTKSKPRVSTLKSLEDLKSRLKYADPDDAPHMMSEIARLRAEATVTDDHNVEVETDEVETTDKVESAEETASLRHKRCGKKRQKKILESITVDDLILIGKGRTRTDDLKRYLKEFGINNPEFILDKMKKSGKLVYSNNMYNCIMKKDINAGVRNRFLNYYDQILADADKFGQQVTARIWDADPSTISLIVNKMG